MARQGKVIGNIRQAQPAVRSGWTSPFDDIERLFDEFLARGMLRSPGALSPAMPAFEGRQPRVDVVDRENELLVRAELPGVRKEDVELSVDENSLTIRATSGREQTEEQGNYYRSEIFRGEFLRTVPLPTYVDGDKAEARFADGILEVTLPKMEQSRRRQIKVR